MKTLNDKSYLHMGYCHVVVLEVKPYRSIYKVIFNWRDVRLVRGKTFATYYYSKSMTYWYHLFSQIWGILKEFDDNLSDTYKKNMFEIDWRTSNTVAISMLALILKGIITRSEYFTWLQYFEIEIELKRLLKVTSQND